MEQDGSHTNVAGQIVEHGEAGSICHLPKAPGAAEFQRKVWQDSY